MQTITSNLRPALEEVHQAAHDQDLIEVSKQASLDRESEQNKYLEITQGDAAPNRSSL
jgi:hypothetical protein